VINSQHHNHTLLCINIYSSHRHLHSFPTRRSSDLEATSTKIIFETVDQSISISRLNDSTSRYIFKKRETRSSCLSDKTSCASGRSEEHTSELQSRFDLVCRLLLDKKT